MALDLDGFKSFIDEITKVKWQLVEWMRLPRGETPFALFIKKEEILHGFDEDDLEAVEKAIDDYLDKFVPFRFDEHACYLVDYCEYDVDSYEVIYSFDDEWLSKHLEQEGSVFVLKLK